MPRKTTPPKDMTDEQPGTAFDLNAHVPYLLVRSANAIAGITFKHYQAAIPDNHDLSLREFRTLLIVATRDGVAPAAVAQATGMDRATVTRALASLRQKGFVTEFRNEQDRRAKFLQLTPAGAELSAQFFPRMEAFNAVIDDTFSAEEINQFSHMLDRMVALFKEVDT